jgi:hypothetical protein
MLRFRSRFAAVAAMLACVSCSAVTPAPVVENQTLRMAPGTLDKIAVMPFQTKDTLVRYSEETGSSPEATAELVARFVTEALVRRGFAVIPPSDVEIALAGSGAATPSFDPRAAAELAARDFGATAVMLGRVSRYRERGGEKYGASTAASVAFDVSIYTAPEAQRVWTSKFDETQRPLSENVINARRYPGGGTRWLTAAELAQWGAQSAAETLPARQ